MGVTQSGQRDQGDTTTHTMKAFHSLAILTWFLGGTCLTADGALPEPTNHWTFDGHANDTNGGIIGRPYGPVSFSEDVVARGSKSLHLECCRHKVVLNDEALKDGFTYYTVALWFRAERVGGHRYLYEEGAARTGFAIRLNELNLEAAAIEGGGGSANLKVVTAPQPIEIGKWHHAVATYSNGELSITLDASSTATMSTGFGAFDSHRHPATIGEGGILDWDSSVYFEGYLDDLRIYDGVALTSDQITELFLDQETSASPSDTPSSSPTIAPSVSTAPSTAPSFSSAPTVSAPPSNSPSAPPSKIELPDPSHHWSFDSGDATDSVTGIAGILRSVEFSGLVVKEGRMSLHIPCCGGRVLLRDRGLQEAFSYYTISVWFRAETVGGRRYLYEEGGASNGIAIRLNELNLEAAATVGRDNVVSVAAPLPIEIGKWHHAVLRYSLGEMSITLDGSSTASTNTGFGEFGLHASFASIGAAGLGDDTSSFEGYVDDLRIYDGVVLTDEQIGVLVSGDIVPEGPRAPPSSSRPNFLIIVGDDVNYDSAGFMGGVAPDVTPNLDRLASESRVFTRAHAANSACQPSRQAMLSGKYPPNYGAVGFFPMADGTETSVSRLHDAGYLTAAFHKIQHTLPRSSFPWDLTEDNTPLAGKTKDRIGRSPTLLGEATKQTILAAKAVDKPFLLMVSSADTHKPFAGSRAEAARQDREHIDRPSRTYRASEVTIPAPLPDLPEVREEFAEYASSMRRLDDTIGRCLEELEASGLANNTVVMYLSDNGMPMPFGKFETYRDSLSSPLVVRWPGRFAPYFDNESLVSLTDIAPTLVDMAGLEPLPDIDGRSLVPLIDEEEGLAWRDVVIGTRYEDIWYGIFLNNAKRAALREQGWVDANHNTPGTMKRTMNKRGITDGTFHYVYNHFYNASHPIQAYPYGGGSTFAAMEEAALTDLDMADRMEFYTYRAQEELYNTMVDPGSMHNLVDDPTVATALAALKAKLLNWMEETNDPVAEDYQSFLAGR